MIVNISSFEENYFKNTFNNYFMIEFMSTGKKYIDYGTLQKEVDCLFTGQITDYRSKIFYKLRTQNINIQTFDYLDDKKRIEMHKKSKIYLGLKKFKTDNLPIGTRAWYCLENSFFFITEKSNRKNFLNDFCYEVESNNIENEIHSILNNYEFYKKELIEKFKKYSLLPFYTNKEIKRFINFIVKL